MSDLYLRGTEFEYQSGYSECFVFSPVFKLIPQYVVRQSSIFRQTSYIIYMTAVQCNTTLENL